MWSKATDLCSVRVAWCDLSALNATCGRFAQVWLVLLRAFRCWVRRCRSLKCLLLLFLFVALYSNMCILCFTCFSICHKGISVILPSKILTVGQRFLVLLAKYDWVKDSVVAEPVSLTWEKRVNYRQLNSAMLLCNQSWSNVRSLVRNRLKNTLRHSALEGAGS